MGTTEVDSVLPPEGTACDDFMLADADWPRAVPELSGAQPPLPLLGLVSFTLFHNFLVFFQAFTFWRGLQELTVRDRNNSVTRKNHEDLTLQSRSGAWSV
jgi:hypothetical protein